MTNNQMPEVGTKLEIELLETLNINKKEKLISQVIDIISENCLLVGIPISKGTIRPISVKDEIKLIYTKKGTASYGFKVQVIDRGNKGNIPYLKVIKISDIEKVQRRDYYRLDMVLNVEMHINNDRGEIIKVIEGLSKDISGGGIRVLCKEPIYKGTIIELIIKSEKEPIKVIAEVLRCTLYEELYSQYEVGLKYKDISVNNREKIVKFIFDTQRKMRKKGLI
ncbi:flagellar brake protein [Anaeromicrobium sediminis]|uniref:flagellar brake protein n=1 Tax=Anaeromicrobium sediminis TaxID=1478221 RepID=UPI001595B2DD|nr:PilZ domain-containing protein [Anaeromicrobium sediminis]